MNRRTPIAVLGLALAASSAAASSLPPMASPNATPKKFTDFTTSYKHKLPIGEFPDENVYAESVDQTPGGAVPLPSAIGMGALGLGAVVARRRRR